MTQFDLPAEKPFRLFVNDKMILTLMATPHQLDELICGWLWSNDLIASATDITKLYVDVTRSIIFAEIKGEAPREIQRVISSGCGGGEMIANFLDAIPEVQSSYRTTMENLIDLQVKFLKNAILYNRTGGVHGAALGHKDKILFTAEDIGRHNAVDKVIGWSLVQTVEFEDKIILTTGRISSEMLFKVAKAGIPIVSSLTAATDLAVKLADKAGITIVGYTGKRKAAVYCRAERIEISQK